MSGIARERRPRVRSVFRSDIQKPGNVSPCVVLRQPYGTTTQGAGGGALAKAWSALRLGRRGVLGRSVDKTPWAFGPFARASLASKTETASGAMWIATHGNSGTVPLGLLSGAFAALQLWWIGGLLRQPARVRPMSEGEFRRSLERIWRRRT